MLKSFVLTLVVVIAAVAVVAAKGKDVKLTGYIVDNACAAKMSKDGDKAKGHPKACAQMQGCIDSGHQIYADGKWYKFDKASESKVADVVKNEKSDKGLQVTVEGSLDGDTITVKSISEVSS
jgi:hypothetical protein